MKVDKKDSLLSSFIREKRRGYTPTGRYAFPHNKHHSALLFLSNLSLKQIAEIAEISYSLLRKWTTEKKFIELVSKHYEEFVALLIRHMHAKAKNQEKRSERYLKKSIEEMSKSPRPEISSAEFTDIIHYNRCLLNDIQIALSDEENKFVDKMNEISNDGKKMVFFLEQFTYHEQLCFLSDRVEYALNHSISKKEYTVLRGKNKSTVEFKRPNHSIFLKVRLGCAIVVLRKKNLNELDKKLLYVLITDLISSLE